MSPSVGNFVRDLVEMAQATERVPQLEEEIASMRKALSEALDHNAGLEVNIISYKQQIDDLQAKVRSLEVERDDASFRVMEAEDVATSTLLKAKDAQVILNDLITKLEPPKPVLEPQALPSETVDQPSIYSDPQYSPPDATHISGSDWPGQSESSPTVQSETIQHQSASSETVSNQENASVSSSSGEQHEIIHPQQVDDPSLPKANPSHDYDPEPEPRYTYEWYQWNDRRNERAKAASEGRTTTFEVTVPSSMEEIERQAIEATLDYTEGDKSHAARALGIGRKTLYRKLEQYNGKSMPPDSTEN